MKLRDVNAAKRATESEFSPDRGTPRNGRLHGGHCLRARSHTASDRRPVPLLKLRPSCVIFFSVPCAGDSDRKNMQPIVPTFRDGFPVLFHIRIRTLPTKETLKTRRI